jgi:hypothetical protein
LADRGGNGNPAKLGLMVAVASGKRRTHVPQHQILSLVGKDHRPKFDSSIFNEAFSSVLSIICDH